jgi:hypothetical protein
MMDPGYLMAPLLMGHVTSLVQSIKTGNVLMDCLFLCFLLILYYKRRYLTTNLWQRVPSFYGWACRITIAAQETSNGNSSNRSLRFRALMHYLASRNQHVYQLREITEFEYLRDMDEEKKKECSEYVVDQPTVFSFAPHIFGRVSVSSKETHRDAAYTEIVDMRTLEIYSYKLNLDQLQEWIEEQVKAFKAYLRLKSNEHQLLITASLTPAKKETSSSNNSTLKKRPTCGNASSISLDVAKWQSTITFENSYFHGMADILPQIDFFLQNEAWYTERGIPYNLGILLTGIPGGGKTRFIKQLLNYTGKHAIDIKLNDQMDFTDLQQIIFKEQLSEDLIIPQEHRILILEDIDAMGDTVKERTEKKTVENSVNDAPPIASLTATANVLAADLLKAQQKLNLSALLNLLDGINECKGRILVMTTNHVEVLDKALIRPGRIDIRINFQQCTRYDIARLLTQYYDEEEVTEDMILPVLEGKYTPAEIMNICRATPLFAKIRAEFCSHL